MHESHERHRGYRMTCAQFDEVTARSAGRCEICDIPAEQTWRKKLVIDHEYDKGIWAVRGLLCPPCNTAIGAGAAHNDRAAVYLANPWYVPMIASAGYPGGERPEPPDGSRLRDGARGAWERRGDQWWPTQGYYKAPMSWTSLLHHFGPHHLSLIDEHL